ncbi:hypothetical protein WUBG_00645 [Wuchereria bancrofti]|uniref:Uncharacterized protein n=1 Tax=Wuchereria bancrofti TaxID=6293 RepID=J9F0N2_WUCBA|nr:hypothetical protein WUBG_00645 [Wuchereria bancrofti]
MSILKLFKMIGIAGKSKITCLKNYESDAQEYASDMTLKMNTNERKEIRLHQILPSSWNPS